MTATTTNAPLASLVRRFRIGDLTPNAHLERLRDRVEAVDPTIRALLAEDDRWARLERDATAVESRYSDPAHRPPLYGVPVGVKDIFHAEGFETRAGSEVPPTELAGPEASTVTSLKEAGAVLLGKTVTTEFAYFESGPTRNPHDTDHTPGGSSSGSAAAVAAGLCPLALGSQTIGSVNRPAAFCGVVGVKPSYGRIPIDGVLPVAPSVDHVGYFTQDVAGATLAAGVLFDDWRADDEPPTLERIAAVDGPYLEQASATGREHFQSHVERLDAAGYGVERLEFFPDLDDVNRRHNRLVAAETALSHAELFPEHGDDYAAATADLIREGHGVAVEELAAARAGRSALREQVHSVLDDGEFDVIISPAAPGPAPEGIGSTGDPVMNLPWTHAGLPTVTLPASVTEDGLPIGLQCSARYGFDEWLLSWCRELSAALP